MILLIIATVGAWLFEDNGQTCLSKDFVFGNPRAICWKQCNDYENVITVSDQMYTVLSRLLLMSATLYSMLGVEALRAGAAV